MTTPSYYVTIDSEFRDDQKYPFPTDFSVKFKDTTTGTQVLGVPTGPNIQDSFFTPLQIDPDFKTIDLRVKNGTITNVKRVSTNKILCCGLGIPEPNVASYNLEVYNDSTIYISVTINSTDGIVPYLLCMDYDGTNYTFNWIIYALGVNNITDRSSFEVDVNNNIFFAFDYSAIQMQIKIDTGSGVPGTFYTIKDTSFPVNNNSILAITAFTLLGDVYTINGHSWGYHLYSCNSDLKSTMPSGRFNLNIDTALNLYISANINPYNPTLTYSTGTYTFSNNVYSWGTPFSQFSTEFIAIYYSIPPPLYIGGEYQIRALRFDRGGGTSSLTELNNNIVTTVPGPFPNSDYAYPMFPMFGNNSFGTLYSGNYYIITASRGTPGLIYDFVLSGMDITTGIFTWGIQTANDSGDANFKFSNAIRYNNYMICVTPEYTGLSPGPAPFYNQVRLRYSYLDLTNIGAGFQTLLNTNNIFNFNSNFISSSNYVKPSMYLDGNTLYVMVGDLYSKVTVIVYTLSGALTLTENSRSTSLTFSSISSLPIPQMYKVSSQLYILLGFEDGTNTVLLSYPTYTALSYLNALYNPCQIIPNYLGATFIFDSKKTVYNVSTPTVPILITSQFPNIISADLYGKYNSTSVTFGFVTKDFGSSGKIDFYISDPLLKDTVLNSQQYYKNDTNTSTIDTSNNVYPGLDLVILDNSINIVSLVSQNIIIDNISTISNIVSAASSFPAINASPDTYLLNNYSFTLQNLANFKTIRYNDFIYVFIAFFRTGPPAPVIAGGRHFWLAVTKMDLNFNFLHSTYTYIVYGGLYPNIVMDMNVFVYNNILSCNILLQSDVLRCYNVVNDTIYQTLNVVLPGPSTSPIVFGATWKPVAMKQQEYPNNTNWCFVQYLQDNYSDGVFLSNVYSIDITNANTGPTGAITSYNTSYVQDYFGGHYQSFDIFRYPDASIYLFSRSIGNSNVACWNVTNPTNPTGTSYIPGWNYQPNQNIVPTLPFTNSPWNYNNNIGPLKLSQNPLSGKIYGYQTQTPVFDGTYESTLFTNYFAYRDYTNISSVPGSNLIPIDVTGVTGARCVDIKIGNFNQKVYAVLVISTPYQLLTTTPNSCCYKVYDMTNPDFAATYYSPTQDFIRVEQGYLMGLLLGNSFLEKINAEGISQWLDQFGGGYSIGASRGLDVNVNNMIIDNTLNYMYIIGGWKYILETYRGNEFILKNQVTSNYSSYNGFICKIDLTTNGQFVWLMPSYGSSDIYFERLNYISSKNLISFVTHFSTPIMLLNDIQLSGVAPYTNPVTSILNLTNTSSETSALITITPAGKLSFSCKLFTNQQSSYIRLYDLSIDEATSLKTIKVIGITNTNELRSIDSSNIENQITYTNIDPILQQSLIFYSYDLNGLYLNSDRIEFPPNMTVEVSDIKSFSISNRIGIFPNIKSLVPNTYINLYNKDGTLATGTNTYFTNNYNSLFIQYLYNPTYTDINGVNYSKIILQDTFNFTPESLVNYHLFIQGNLFDSYIGTTTQIADTTTLNKNFTIRHNFIENSKDTLILNQVIDIKNIVRKNLSYQGTEWAGSISPSELPGIISYNNTIAPSNPIIITALYGLTSINTSATGYYLMYATGTEINYITINSITYSAGAYQMNITNPSQALNQDLPPGIYYGPYIYFTETNQNAYYTLQFSPGTIYDKVYYNLKLNSLLIPNRRITSSFLPGTRSINDFRYIYLEVYNEDDNGNIDISVVNNYFTNNQNFVSLNQRTKTLFEIPIAGVSVNSDTNFVVLSTTSNIPILVISPGYYNLHIRLVDMYGNIINFDSTPNSAKTSDSIFSGSTVDTSLMQIAANFTFTKITK